jgi:hypothetical protein
MKRLPSTFVATPLLVFLGQYILAVCSLIMPGCSNRPIVDEIELWQAQDITKVIGFTWPRNDQDERASQEFATIEKPISVILHLPSGKKFGVFSRITFLSQRQKLLSRVVVSPLSEAVSFKQAVEVVSNIARALDIQNDDYVKMKIRDFQTKPPEWDAGGFSRVSLACNLEQETNVYMEIRPASANDKWLVTISFLARGLYDLP